MEESDIEITADVRNIENLQRSYGTNWVKKNIRTLNRWISIGAHNIKILEIAIDYNRRILRWNSVLGIVLSTATGTLSASQFNVVASTTVFYALFAVLSFAVACSAGFMKIYQIQEKLEEYIKLKQQWIAFSTLIFSEFQLPIHLRQDALFLIWKYKGQYLDLLKVDLEISGGVRKRAEKEIHLYASRFDERTGTETWFSTSLPNLIIDTMMYNSAKPADPNATTAETRIHRNASFCYKVSTMPEAQPKQRLNRGLMRARSTRHGCVQPPDSPTASEHGYVSNASEEKETEHRIAVVPDQTV
jgi:hypothetical protein